MATVNVQPMALSPEQLNEPDRWILDYLSDEGRATPNLLRLRYSEAKADNDDEEDIELMSRQWISNRVRRLAEHGHITRVHPDDSTYEFVSDPREETPETAQA